MSSASPTSPTRDRQRRGEALRRRFSAPGHVRGSAHVPGPPRAPSACPTRAVSRWLAGAVTDDETPQAKKNGHGTGSRERRLRALPHWDEIEVRLQHRWTPERVLEWHARTFPGAAAPSRRTLYRFLEDQPERWYVPKLGIDQNDTKRVPPRIRVIEQHADLVETQTLRLSRALKKENEMDGHLIPEVSRNIELLNRLHHQHLVTQQELGIEPRVTAPGKPGVETDPERGLRGRELVDFAHRVAELPEGQWAEVVTAILGPPPVKQPLVLDGEAIVLEKRPLPPEEEPR